MNEEERILRIKKRIEEKIKELNVYLDEFQEIEIPDFEIYKKDFRIKGLCERYFEKIIESVLSISILIIRLKNLKEPENEDHVFYILFKEGIISETLGKRLKDAKDMRNIIIHNYIKAEDFIIYEAITNELIRDIDEFLKEVNKIL
jgi:uncharacterized protein YutE (UPF0331/DUF86 family)